MHFVAKNLFLNFDKRQKNDEFFGAELTTFLDRVANEKPRNLWYGVFRFFAYLPIGFGAGAGRGGLFPRPGPEGFAVLLGAFGGTGRFPLLM